MFFKKEIELKAVKCYFIVCFCILLFSGSLFADEPYWRNGDWVIDKRYNECDGDGIIDYVDKYIYDDNLKLIKVELDSDIDETAYSYNEVEYFYDDNSNQIKFVFGNLTKTTFYDSSGAIVKLVKSWDYGIYANSSYVTMDQYFYDIDELIITYLEICLYQGQLNYQILMKAPTGGIIEEAEYDCSPVIVYNYTYADNGKVIRSEDWNNDGINEIVFISEKDADGDLIKIEVDSDPDGDIDSVYTYINDARGNLLQIEIDSDNDGTTDTITRANTYTYDENGNITKIESDTDNNGTINNVTVFTYDTYGNKIKEEYDDDNDGAFDRSYSYCWKDTSTTNTSCASFNSGSGSGGCFINNLF